MTYPDGQFVDDETYFERNPDDPRKEAFMKDREYRLVEGRTLPKDGRDVIRWKNGPDAVFPDVGVAFRCPCGERIVCIDPANHRIDFDADGRLTLDPSIGSHKSGDPERPDYRPPNWCHFWLKNGVARMTDDAKCPGGSR